jgi:DNA replication protein DnaC
MAEIKTFKFDRNNFDDIRGYRFGKNWPVVYVLENGKDVYVGQAINAHRRLKQHYDNIEKQILKLKTAHILSDDEFNVSAALDIEAWLIQYMSADQVFTLHNKNGGLKNHNYYDRPKYKAKFEDIWKQFLEMGIAKSTLEDLKNTDLFKYSPYKSLTEDQLFIARKIFKDIKSGNSQTFIINGKPGTGKTILATYLFKFLKEQDETKNLKMALVVPMTSLRTTIKKVFGKIKGLSSSMVIGPNDVARDFYDLVIVDEAHRLQRRKKYYGNGCI